jgi:hypothetical protein
MRWRTSDDRDRRAAAEPSPQPLAAVTTEHLKAAVDAAVGPVRSELRWQRWLLFVLVAAVFSPKLGGPAAPAIAAWTADPNMGPHVFELARAHVTDLI